MSPVISLRAVATLLLVSVSLEVEAKTMCMRAVGKLVCDSDPTKAANIEMDLMDFDGLPLEVDDHMGKTWSSVNGSFEVSGCGHDVGPWNTPDPYIRIKHFCPPSSNPSSTVQRKTEIFMWPTFLPKIVQVGTIYLDDEDQEKDA
uniref:Uncharacterized protein n=1 Tax=Plectus sambesii TaxID=2011161 RepID=A0A914WEG8_9BILA